MGDESLPSHVRVVSKVMPVDKEGKVARGVGRLKGLEIAAGEEKTSGEKLAEQIFQASNL